MPRRPKYKMRHKKNTSGGHNVTRDIKREILLILMYVCGEYNSEDTVILHLISQEECRKVASKLRKYGWCATEQLEGNDLLVKNAPHKRYMRHAVKRNFFGRDKVNSLRKNLQYLYSPLVLRLFKKFLGTKTEDNRIRFDFSQKDKKYDAREFAVWLDDIYHIPSQLDEEYGVSISTADYLNIVIPEQKEAKEHGKKEKTSR